MSQTKTAPAPETETAPTLPERDHLEGCPESRVERFEAVRPGRVAVLDDGSAVRAPNTTVVVTRCLECGGERVTDKDGKRI